MPDPKTIQCGCGASHTPEHPHFGEPVIEHDRGCSALNDRGYRRCNCSRRTEDQERGGATVDVEAIKQRFVAAGFVPEEGFFSGPLDAITEVDQHARKDVWVLAMEVESLKAQLAERDAQQTVVVRQLSMEIQEREALANENEALRGALEKGKQLVEEMDQRMPEQATEDASGWIISYRIPVGPWHRLLGWSRGGLIVALDQAQQQQETSQEGQQPQQTLEQHSGEPEAVDPSQPLQAQCGAGEGGQ